MLREPLSWVPAVRCQRGTGDSQHPPHRFSQSLEAASAWALPAPRQPRGLLAPWAQLGRRGQCLLALRTRPRFARLEMEGETTSPQVPENMPERRNAKSALAPVMSPAVTAGQRPPWHWDSRRSKAGPASEPAHVDTEPGTTRQRVGGQGALPEKSRPGCGGRRRLGRPLRAGALGPARRGGTGPRRLQERRL